MNFIISDSIIEWFYFVMVYACFISFWHSSLVVFKKKQKVKAKKRWLIKIVSICLWNSVPVYFFFVANSISLSFIFISIVLTLISLYVYWSSVVTVKEKSFAVIATTATPEFINKTGTYKYIRHPFYLAYILCYLGVCLAMPYAHHFIFIGLLILSYIIEAKYEEHLFLQSPQKEEYKSYQATTGMFLPKLLKRSLRV